MRTIVEARNLWNERFSAHPRLEDIKRAVISNDTVKNPCEDGLRSVCWKAFLLDMGFDTDDAKWVWCHRLQGSRDAYAALRNAYLRYIEHPDDLSQSADPLADDENSPWQALRQDEALREEICQDVDRCMQDNHYFRDPRVKRRMLDILFVYARLNSDIGYRQGMHEILAPVMWVIEADSVGTQSEPEPWGEDETLLTTLDSRYIEHDAFTLFTAIMQNVKVLYEHGDGGDGKPADVDYESPIVARSRRIHEVMLFRVDYELAEHLAAIDILPQIFITRWIRLLFGREFPFGEVLSVWDMLFAESVRLELIDHICVAMLLRIRWLLLDADYSGALSLLLKYPSPRPYHARTFVSDALFLEKDPTIQGGSSVILKYSDRIPSFSGRSPPRRPRTNRYVTPPVAMSSRATPKMNRRLDSLFQDVSGNVAKAVKGAMVEARRNFNAAGTQHHGNIPLLRRSSGSAESGLSPSNPSAAAMAELNKRVFRLESRSKALGVMLAEALSQFRAAQKCQPQEPAKDDIQHEGEKESGAEKDQQSPKESGDETPLPIDVLLAKVQFVQVYLDDPTIPIDGVETCNPDSPFTIAGSEWDKMSIRSPSAANSSPAKALGALPLRKKSSSLSPNLLDSSSSDASSASRSPPTVPGVDGVAETAHLATRDINPRKAPQEAKQKAASRATSHSPGSTPHTRAPLSESPFSWMLGEPKDKKAEFRSPPFIPTAATTPPARGEQLFRDINSNGVNGKALQHGRNMSLEKLGL